ncbi:type 4 pilus major pilin, partial [Desulfovibrio piger]|nr:type 4 pilus major pilin [Desulfovibrio piger]
MGELGPIIGRLLIGLLIIGAAAIGINSAYSKINIGTTQENLVVLRMEVQKFFTGSSYADLSNDVAINAGLVPQSFISDGTLKNAWGGDITLSGDASNGTFSIELTNIPQSECTQLARFQGDAWEGIAVNGAELDFED